MSLLALDFGTSSLKAAVLRGSGATSRVVVMPYKLRLSNGCAEVLTNDVLRALRQAIAALPLEKVKAVDYVAIAGMSPAWCAMDARGRALTPLVIHQDRRSIAEAHEIERRVGRARHLKIAGNRPVPGGISSTTFLWFCRHRRDLMQRADLVGHLNTFLHRQLTGARVIDPGNASFTGLCETTKLGDWSQELMEAAGANRKILPEIVDGNVVAGRVTRAAARRFGLPEGLPMLTGLIDTSAAMLMAGTRAGQMLNVCGSTDALAVCCDEPAPDELYLTRALGIGRKWLSVCTIAAAGSALEWAHRTLFSEISAESFYRLIERVETTSVKCDPDFAGSRVSIEQPMAAFTNLTLSTTREDLLRAIVDALRKQSAARIPILTTACGAKLSREVVVSGGAGRILQRYWRGKWKFRYEPEATLRGLGKMEPKEV